MLADSLSLAVGSSSAADAAADAPLNSDDDAGDDAPAPEQSDAPLLPKATVKALVRDLLPEAMRASEQASDAVNVCLSEFLQVLTWKANEALEQEGTKKVLTDEHIGAALKELGLERYVEASKLPLERKAPKAKAKAPAAAAEASEPAAAAAATAGPSAAAVVDVERKPSKAELKAAAKERKRQREQAVKGLSHEELLAQQQALFSSARASLSGEGG